MQQNRVHLCFISICFYSILSAYPTNQGTGVTTKRRETIVELNNVPVVFRLKVAEVNTEGLPLICLQEPCGGYVCRIMSRGSIEVIVSVKCQWSPWRKTLITSIVAEGQV